jgi:hypothetical protein
MHTSHQKGLAELYKVETKKQRSRMDMFSPSGIESCGSEPAKAKEIARRKSQQTVVAASPKIQK